MDSVNLHSIARRTAKTIAGTFFQRMTSALFKPVRQYLKRRMHAHVVDLWGQGGCLQFSWTCRGCHVKGDEKTFSIISKESDWDGKKVPRLGIVKLDLWILQKGLTIGPSGVMVVEIFPN